MKIRIGHESLWLSFLVAKTKGKLVGFHFPVFLFLCSWGTVFFRAMIVKAYMIWTVSKIQTHKPPPRDPFEFAWSGAQALVILEGTTEVQ